MKNYLLIPVLVLSLVSCGSASRAVFGTTEKTLIKTVSIEQGCDDVKILDRVKGLHGATYALDVCGKRMVYKQIGSVFMEASQADETVKNITN